MRRLRRAALFASLAATTALGCGGEVTVGGGGAAAGAGGSGASGGGGGGGGTGGAPGAFGAVRVAHVVHDDPAYPWEQLSLSGAFFAVDFDPDAVVWGFVDTQLTPDGVACDLFYQSGMGGAPPSPPPELDAGHLAAGQPSEPLGIDFDGLHYDVDSRTPGDPTHPMPGWLVPGEVALGFSGSGSAAVAAFAGDAVLPAAPTIVAPTPDQSPVPLQPDDTHLVAWQPAAAGAIVVRLDFNLDWDNSIFLCRPAPGVTQLSLPHAWLTQFTWGYGELSLEARNEVAVPAAGALVRLRPTRVRRQSVHFEVW